jgi:uncharacterized membrane protein
MKDLLLITSQWTRAGAALLLIVCLPGYLFSLALFPRRKLDRLERIFITFCMGITLASTTASVLLWGSKRLTDLNFATSMLVLALLSSVGAYWHDRREIDDNETHDANLARETARAGLGRILLPLASAFVMVAALTVSDSPSDDLILESGSLRGSSGITEFYITPAHVNRVLDSAADFRGILHVPLEIVNHTSGKEVYRIQAELTGQTVWQRSGIRVGAGQSWREAIDIKMSIPSDLAPLDIKLLCDELDSPVANLRLWLD